MIEVLVAMVILAVGLLGLQALGVGAVRMMARADTQTTYARLASQDLELALQEIRGGRIPQSKCEFLPGARARLSRIIGGLATRRPTVTVRVAAEGDGVAPPVELQGSVYTPDGLEGTDAGRACAQ